MSAGCFWDAEVLEDGAKIGFRMEQVKTAFDEFRSVPGEDSGESGSMGGMG